MADLRVAPQRIEFQLLTHRLDCPFYNPDAMNLDRKFKQYKNLKRLAEIVDSRRKITNGVRGPELRQSNYRLVRLQDCQNWSINFDGCLTISESQFKENRRCQLFEGDIVVAIGGYIGHASIVRNVKPSVIGQHSAVLPCDLKRETDEGYLAAYLNSVIGTIQLQRYVSGTVQPGINLEDLRDITIPVIGKPIQNYIGDKVRQAEELRERSRNLEQQAKKLFKESLFWAKELESQSICCRLKVRELEQRLDLNFNSPIRLRLINYLKKHEIRLEELNELVTISAMIGWKGLTTEYYTEEGPWLLRGVEFFNGIIDFDALVSIEQYKYDEQPQIHLEKGDIALTKDGTIGKAIVIPDLSKALAAGSTIARLRPYPTDKINPYYLEYALNHPVMQIQIMSFATGIAQPHITQEWIGRLQVPRCDVEEEIGRYICYYHQAQVYASYLTTAAKLLVEALIEGKVTEEELKAAQEALQQGSRELDRAILARLTRKGIDVPDEPPLFPDLDALYQALDDLNVEDAASDRAIADDASLQQNRYCTTRKLVTSLYPTPKAADASASYEVAGEP